MGGVVRALRHQLPIQDRFVKVKLIKNCFSGAELPTWWMPSRTISSAAGIRFTTTLRCCSSHKQKPQHRRMSSEAHAHFGCTILSQLKFIDMSSSSAPGFNTCSISRSSRPRRRGAEWATGSAAGARGPVRLRRVLAGPPLDTLDRSSPGSRVPASLNSLRHRWGAKSAPSHRKIAGNPQVLLVIKLHEAGAHRRPLSAFQPARPISYSSRRSTCLLLLLLSDPVVGLGGGGAGWVPSSWR
nr:unnamed protein product [Digitaria exilis]